MMMQLFLAPVSFRQQIGELLFLVCRQRRARRDFARCFLERFCRFARSRSRVSQFALQWLRVARTVPGQFIFERRDPALRFCEAAAL